MLLFICLSVLRNSQIPLGGIYIVKIHIYTACLCNSPVGGRNDIFRST